MQDYGSYLKYGIMMMIVILVRIGEESLIEAWRRLDPKKKLLGRSWLVFGAKVRSNFFFSILSWRQGNI
jgi:hypothetical protein